MFIYEVIYELYTNLSLFLTPGRERSGFKIRYTQMYSDIFSVEQRVAQVESGKIVLGPQGGLWKIASRELITFVVRLWNIHQAAQREDFESIGIEIINPKLVTSDKEIGGPEDNTNIDGCDLQPGSTYRFNS